MTGLTQAYRADGTSEGDLQALRPGLVREIAVTSTPNDFTPTVGVGLIEIEAEGEALLHVRTNTELDNAGKLTALDAIGS